MNVSWIVLSAFDHPEEYFENLVLALLPVIGTTDTIRILARELAAFYYSETVDYDETARQVVKIIKGKT